ncbi:diguanylate cyclase (GGDEF) domain-containing protein [Collimonas sp. OK242]|jgi:diguanylate cyclase (GGDEF)-like protein|uniref:GGDEF domain-containing protein n=1 Tax=Collimonas sp. OK242 TaxID=1798195 RepID=UPI00089B4077|nr:diguanylate cyclase (GGDEF) domain-containing protein [Collimonas sp. OK242]
MDMSATIGMRPEPIRRVTKIYAAFLLAAFALSPAVLIAYLYFFQDPALKFDNHLFHEIAIAAATLEGLFVTYVSWRCYLSSGEPLLRWLTLSFLGFTLIYALHGAFTGMAHHNIWLFLLYGPASRLAMAILLLIGLLSFNLESDTPQQRVNPRSWLIWVALFLLIDIAVAILAYSPIAGNPAVRLTLEGGALFFSALNLTIMLAGRIRSPLMTIFGISIALFGLSSLAFILGRPWNHMWWLAHAIFAGGFFFLSYGIIQAFHTTRSFSNIYNQEQMVNSLAMSMVRTENALQELKHSNQMLEHLASTDPLTGAANRRHFIERVDAEIARAKRDNLSFSLLALDLDNFKSINDHYGHQVGDEVLQGFVQKCLEEIRPYDSVARMGGEEFMILLPQATLEVAMAIGERIRSATENTEFTSGAVPKVILTVSIGVSQFGHDGNTIDTIFRAADERLYRAKNHGRNCVVTA